MWSRLSLIFLNMVLEDLKLFGLDEVTADMMDDDSGLSDDDAEKEFDDEDKDGDEDEEDEEEAL